MARFVELRRHTDNDGDVLSDEGVAAALRLGAGLAGGYRVAVCRRPNIRTRWIRSSRWAPRPP